MKLARVDQVVDNYHCEESALIQVLLDIQREHHWLPSEFLVRISNKLNIPLTRIYHVVTFYEAFTLTPVGRHRIAICMGTACYVRGSPRVLDKVEDRLCIKLGETTADQRFTLATVNCLGCCALGPVMVVDEDYHGKMLPDKVDKILKSYE